MNSKRQAKFERVVRQRQGNLTVVLENVHDLHNVGAVLRSCDSVGIFEIFLLDSNPEISRNNPKLGKRTSAGARKWIDVYHYKDVDQCFADVREKYDKVYVTHLSSESVELYDLDLTESVALVFGNEHWGISEATRAHLDSNFIIPQVGMVESLNISVACAITLYEAFRQRRQKNFYLDNPTMTAAEQTALFEKYVQRHTNSDKNQRAKTK